MTVQARNYTPTNGRQIDLIVIHDMEAPEAQDTAENVANWFAGPNAPRASAHWCFDPDSAVRCVEDKDVAWHAPGANSNGLGYEHSGYAAQTRGEWLDDASMATLRISAAQAAEDCRKYALPDAFVDAEGLLRGERGITTHLEVTRAYHKGTHWDPGYEFPMDVYLQLVGEAGGQGQSNPANPPVAQDDHVLREGDSGPAVEEWQAILIGANLPVGSADGQPDGSFGPTTKQSTMDLQRAMGFSEDQIDGEVGPYTREQYARLLAWLKAVANQGTVPAPPPQEAFPVFPLPEGHWFGPPSKDDANHSGFYSQDDASMLAVWQGRMAERGWAINTDGKFTDQTASAALSFQQEKGLGQDGLVGPETWNAAWTSPVT